MYDRRRYAVYICRYTERRIGKNGNIAPVYGEHQIGPVRVVDLEFRQRISKRTVHAEGPFAGRLDSLPETGQRFRFDEVFLCTAGQCDDAQRKNDHDLFHNGKDLRKYE